MRMVSYKKQKKSQKFIQEKTEEYTEQLHQINSQLEQSKKHLDVVKKTLKRERNKEIQEWELETPKDIRAGAVEDVCKAHKTALANFKAGNIKFFKLGFRKKINPKQSLLIPKSAIKNNDGEITIYSKILKGNKTFPMGKRTKKKHKDLIIEHDCRLVKEKNEFHSIMLNNFHNNCPAPKYNPFY
jgi:hypothetical protein